MAQDMAKIQKIALCTVPVALWIKLDTLTIFTNNKRTFVLIIAADTMNKSKRHKSSEHAKLRAIKKIY